MDVKDREWWKLFIAHIIDRILLGLLGYIGYRIITKLGLFKSLSGFSFPDNVVYQAIYAIIMMASLFFILRLIGLYSIRSYTNFWFLPAPLVGGIIAIIYITIQYGPLLTLIAISFVIVSAIPEFMYSKLVPLRFKRDQILTDDHFNFLPIAKRISRKIRTPEFQTIGLFGIYGSGKSWVIDTALDLLSSEKQIDGVIINKVDAWGYKPDTLVRLMLNSSIKELSKYIDTAPVNTLPSSYTHALGQSNSYIGMLLATQSNTDPLESIQRMDDLLKLWDKELLIVLQDADRSISTKKFNREIFALFDRLNTCKQITCILAAGNNPEFKEGFRKVCQWDEVMPTIAPSDAVRRILDFREEQFSKYESDFAIESRKRIDERFGLRDSEGADPFYQQETYLGPVDILARLLNNPRTLETVFQKTDGFYAELHGEVNFDILFVKVALKEALEAIYDFLNDNIHDMRAQIIYKSNANNEKQYVEEIEKRLKLAIDSLDDNFREDWIRKLLNFLISGWDIGKEIGHISLQGLVQNEPVDFWKRINAGEISEGEIQDQVVLQTFESLSQLDKTSDDNINIALKNLLSSHNFAMRFEQVAENRLTVLQLQKLMSRYADAILAGMGERQTKDTYTRGYPGFLGLWRLYINHSDEKPEHGRWILDILNRAMKKNLRFTQELFHYWVYEKSHDVDHKSHDPKITAEYLANIRDTFANDPHLLANCLPTDYPYTISQIINEFQIVKTKSPTLPVLSWLGKTLLVAAKIDAKKVAQQMMPLMTEHALKEDEMFSSYAPKYELLDEMFGDQLREAILLVHNHLDKAELSENFQAHADATLKFVRNWLKENPENPNTEI